MSKPHHYNLNKLLGDSMITTSKNEYLNFDKYYFEK